MMKLTTADGCMLPSVPVVAPLTAPTEKTGWVTLRLAFPLPVFLLLLTVPLCRTAFVRPEVPLCACPLCFSNVAEPSA